MSSGPAESRSGPLLVIWLLVLLEFVSPIPGFLTLGAIYVLLFRPPWFLDWVRWLYRDG